MPSRRQIAPQQTLDRNAAMQFKGSWYRLKYAPEIRSQYFTEHHLNQHEINLIQIDSYTLGASFCRNSFKMGGVCIFVNKNLNFMNIDLQKFSHERDIEVGAVKIFVNSANICILSIYRAPSGNFALFLDKLEVILNLLHRNNTQLIICGDLNINYLFENNKKNSFGFFTGLL